MTAIFSTASKRLQENAHRQAKRLKTHLNIPLTHAKYILAVAAYQCHDWPDLLARLDSSDMQGQALLLSLLPDSTEAKAYLSQNMRQIARSIGRHVLTNCNLAGVYQIVRSVFEDSDIKVELSDIADSLIALPWRSANIGPDPHAVIETFTVINDVSMKLIGTRVYLPEYLDLGDEFGDVARCASHVGTPLEIMWANPKAWRAAAYAYLSIPDDDFGEAEFSLPPIELDQSMRVHEEWFKKVLSVWDWDAKYCGEEESEFIPLVTRSECYMVFGVPSPLDNGACTPEKTSIALSGETDNDSKLVILNGQPLCIEWLSVSPSSDQHDGPFNEYFTSIRTSLFDHPDCDLKLFSRNSPCTSFFFVKPASQWDIRMTLKLDVIPDTGQEACIIKTDHIQITADVLDKVGNRDLKCFKSKSGLPRYVMEIDVTQYENCNGFSLALNITGEAMFSGSNLVLTTVFYTEENGRKTTYLELSARLFALVDLIGKRNVLDAAKHGLVFHRDQGFHTSLDRLPRWCDSLQELPPTMIEAFDGPLDSNGPISLVDLWRNAKIVKYRKDNY